MKSIVLFVLLLLSYTTFAQDVPERYIQLNGNVNSMGVIKMTPLPKAKNPDPLIDYTSIDEIIRKDNTPTYVLNELAKQGWSLVSAVFIKTEIGSLFSGDMVYYLKKSFTTAK